MLPNDSIKRDLSPLSATPSGAEETSPPCQHFETVHPSISREGLKKLVQKIVRSELQIELKSIKETQLLLVNQIGLLLKRTKEKKNMMDEDEDEKEEEEEKEDEEEEEGEEEEEEKEEERKQEMFKRRSKKKNDDVAGRKEIKEEKERREEKERKEKERNEEEDRKDKEKERKEKENEERKEKEKEMKEKERKEKKKKKVTEEEGVEFMTPTRFQSRHFLRRRTIKPKEDQFTNPSRKEMKVNDPVKVNPLLKFNQESLLALKDWVWS